MYRRDYKSRLIPKNKENQIMVKVTRINKSVLYINPDLIEFIEETPDTVITMTTGKKLIVLESIADIKESIIEYKRKIYSDPPLEKVSQD